MTILHINSIDINDGVADANGSLWYAIDMTGWDAPAVRSSSLPFPGRHGQVTVEGFYSARLIQITGVCKCVSEAAFYTSMYFLMSETNYLGRTPFVFSVEEDITRQANVFRAGNVRTSYLGKNAFDFEVTLRADDPFKYSATLNSEAFVATIPEVIANAGTVRTYPVITLNGTGTPVITVGALTWTATASIPSGTVIDMSQHTVLNGATDHFDKVDLTTEWVWLEPGNNTVECNVPMTVEWRDAWV